MHHLLRHHWKKLGWIVFDFPNVEILVQYERQNFWVYSHNKALNSRTRWRKVEGKKCLYAILFRILHPTISRNLVVHFFVDTYTGQNPIISLKKNFISYWQFLCKICTMPLYSIYLCFVWFTLNRSWSKISASKIFIILKYCLDNLKILP